MIRVSGMWKKGEDKYGESEGKAGALAARNLGQKNVERERSETGNLAVEKGSALGKGGWAVEKMEAEPGNWWLGTVGKGKVEWRKQRVRVMSERG